MDTAGQNGSRFSTSVIVAREPSNVAEKVKSEQPE
jgi:hypothetical protein